MGNTSGSTRSPSLRTSSPRQRLAVVRRSSLCALRPAMRRSISRGRIARSVRGVLDTTVFQMCMAALRTTAVGSLRRAYTAASRSLWRFSPSDPDSARPCASVLTPSSSEPPSTCTFPLAPAMRNIIDPNNSTALWRMRQFSEEIPSSMEGRRRSRLCALWLNSSTNTRPAPSAASRTGSSESASPVSTSASASCRCASNSWPSASGRKRSSVRCPSRTYGAGWWHPARISGSIASKCSAPSTARHSAKPCAAPLRSVMGPSDCRVSVSHGISSAKCSSMPPMPRTKLASAAAAVARTSGLGSTNAF
mmetsp:Transcript_31739/g.79720  ORF Transcript_31739/g.79720 Transcript_31739/m.79720 type:complete len:307 (-) Transcript_31739:2121-3041(-)